VPSPDEGVYHHVTALWHLCQKSHSTQSVLRK